MARVGSDFAHLVFHALAFVPVAPDRPEIAAASLHDPAWIAWAAQHLPSPAVEPFVTFGPALAAGLAALPALVSAQAIATKYASISVFLRAEARGDPRASTAGAAPSALGLDLFRAALGLAAPSLARAFLSEIKGSCERAASVIAPRWAAFAAEVPGVRDLEIHVVAPLRGRARLADPAILVGVPTLPGEDLSAAAADAMLAVAAHEASVRAATRICPRAPWAHVERVALEAATIAFARTSLGALHAQLRASFSEAGLSPPDRQALAEARAAADLLAAPP